MRISDWSSDVCSSDLPDVLDAALLRPGRFDRQVVVPLPDIRGREQIIKVHMRSVPASENVDASIIARGTPGFSGADRSEERRVGKACVSKFSTTWSPDHQKKNIKDT